LPISHNLFNLAAHHCQSFRDVQLGLDFPGRLAVLGVPVRLEGRRCTGVGSLPHKFFISKSAFYFNK
jgi:hypothetical protein